ncbi:TPA: ImmA/IrrE family metallo-endopeptidase [Legionella pneumophila]|uniref:helix-turn-helix domain-containing protein n=1 Tax=Legionella sp. PATHC039 TaxID=2992042 RepID=UPI00077845EA|nr:MULTISPECIES: XRE family transcriptional regulator [Legionella]HAT8860315.1 ImmA/IrrE family metallo-endopeptidase [Legionella pneumophila subsp. pneumophila]MCW8396289.1 XRE family transcriptional regulator [Legionella sp. PATHC039]HAT7073992.1 ImmA/IrrE family metallo-endopeptidase [Legionella pneumophila]HAT8642845.1 ImmA/IrrE family metallo-endopeptidase [Legionella pneumophila]HAT8869476.1 ImmA/IrrE family metallo-endopeptidase [Legionella pneumophila subsp. pneumophila]
MLGNRIYRARKAARLTLRELAEKVSLSHTAIQKYENNEMTPASDMLIKLAKALDVKVEYFFRPERFTLQNIQYRKHADMPEHELEEIKAKILDQIERRIELESLFPVSPIQNFRLGEKKLRSYDDIEKIANEVRRQWNLGLEPIANLIDTFEENGIRVFEIDNQLYPKFDGFSAHINDHPIIVIGSNWPGDRQRFTLAHELGHLVLYGFMHPDLDEERCCNHFAGAFLLPKESLVLIMGEKRTFIEPRELSILKQEFGISMLAILHRAKDVGIITNSVYRKIRSTFNENGWNKKEPGEQYPKQKTYLFEQMIFRALAEEYLGESKAAELLNLNVEQLRAIRSMECHDAVVNQ